jgi:hypothetical protein
MIVARQFLRLQRTALIVWGAVLVLMTLSVTAAAQAATSGDAYVALIKSLAPAMQRVIGGDITGFPNPVDAYVTTKLLLFLPVLLGVYAALAVAAMVARERSKGTLDFLLALPLDRGLVLRQRFVAVAISLALLYGATWVTLVAGLEAAGAPGAYGRYALVLLAGFCINLAQAGILAAVSVAAGEYPKVVRYGLALVLLPYMLNMALQAADVATWLGRPLLYGLINAHDMVALGQFPWAAVVLGPGLAALGLWLAIRLFDRKQLHG